MCIDVKCSAPVNSQLLALPLHNYDSIPVSDAADDAPAHRVAVATELPVDDGVREDAADLLEVDHAHTHLCDPPRHPLSEHCLYHQHIAERL